MPFTSVLHAAINPLIWLPVLLLLLSFALKNPRVKGYLGECRVRLLAGFLLNRKVYRRLHNVTLSTPNGTTQIDHVLLSPYGVFVLETKNMAGWIFGGEHQPQWTQTFYKRTFHFQNPLRQNHAHLKALQATLRLPDEHLHSVVAFVGASTFKTAMPANVTQGSGFIRYIKSFREELFSPAQVEAMLLTLQEVRLAPTFATHRKHVQQLQRRHDPAVQRQCPRCGSALQVRNIKSGPRSGQQFWGCSNYPKCRMTDNMNNHPKQVKTPE